MSGLITVSYFLVSTIFGLITFVLWLRFGLQYFGISSLNPISQVIYRLTNPLFQPMARMLQRRQTRQQRYDWLCLGVLVAAAWVKYLIIGALYFGHSSLWPMTMAYALADLIIQPCNLLFYALVIRVVMSWINPTWQHPLASVLYGVTEPLLARIRRYLPDVAGLDFSPFIMMIVLKIITIFIGASLPM